MGDKSYQNNAQISFIRIIFQFFLCVGGGDERPFSLSICVYEFRNEMTVRTKNVLPYLRKIGRCIKFREPRAKISRAV